MGRAAVLSVLLLAVFAVGCAKCEVVEEADEENFGDYMEANPLVFVEFYAPWCKHCQALAPIYEEFAQEVQSRGVKVLKVDGSENKDLAEQAGVQGFPTLHFFKNRVPHEYDGPRTKEGLLSYVDKCLLPANVIKDADAAQEFLLAEKRAIVAFFPAEDSAEKQTFIKMLDYFQCSNSPFSFALFEGPSVELLGEQFATESLPLYAVVVKGETGEPEYHAYTQRPVEPAALYAWATADILPLLGEINQQSAQLFTDAHLPIAFLIAGEDASYDEIKKQAAQVAADYRHKIVFVWIDSVKYESPVSRIAPHTKDYPAFVITDQMSRYVLPESGEALNGDLIRAFCERFVKGEVPVYRSSEPEPQEQTKGAVHNVVGLTFKKDVVDDKSRDVIVKFYATWCSHCREFAPIYAELATLLADEPTIRVAQINSPDNEVEEELVGVQIQGYPTVVLYPANTKTPVVFEGEHTVASLLQFIKAHASFPLTLQAEDGAEKMEL